jgi:hypothetical protein
VAKPTRKHPALGSLEDSPQGLEFLAWVTRYIGAFEYEPLATFDKGRRHLFTLTGPGGTGILSEAWEEPEGAEARPVWAFYANLPSGLELHLECTGRRWSAGSEIAVTGVDPFPGVSGKKRKELEGDRRREIAAAHDMVTVLMGPPGQAWTELSGIERATVMSELVRLDIRPDLLGTSGGTEPGDGGGASSTGETRKIVEAFLAASVQGFHVSDSGVMSFPMGSTRVFVEVRDWRDPAGVVTVYSITNKSVPRSSDLFEYLASHSDDFVFGRLAAWLPDEEPNSAWIVFRHTLLGSTMDPDELRNAIMAVAVTADQLDDTIKERFGGLLFHEQPPEGAVPGSPSEAELPTGFYL